MLFGKQKFDVKQLKLNKFIFDVKQLKMNRFITSISDLIISTSNATLGAPLLRTCKVKKNNFFYNIIMLGFGKTKAAKEKLYGAK